MNTYVLDFESFNEELLQNNWINYKSGTDVALDKKSSDASMISDKVLKLIGAKDASELLFTGTDVSGGDDFAFMASLLEGLQPDDVDSLQFENYTVYISKFTYEEKPLVKVDIKYVYELSYIFMKQEDFEFFSALAPGGEPEQSQEEQAAQTAQAAIPTAGGTGPTPAGSTIA